MTVETTPAGEEEEDDARLRWRILEDWSGASMQKEVGGMMGGRKRGLQMQAGGMCYFVAAISFVPALHFGVGEEENLVFHS